MHSPLATLGRFRLPIDGIALPIFDAVSEAIFVCSAETLRIIEANPAAVQLYGYGLRELRTMSLLDLSAEPEHARTQVDDAIALGQPKREVRRHRRQDGSSFAVHTCATVFCWRGQRLLLVVTRDYRAQLAAIDAARRHTAQLERSLMGTVEAICAMTELRDPYTAAHERHVAALAERIAVELGMSPSAARGLHVIGLVHDIGKIAVPAEILSRPARLSTAERALVQQHARQGYEVLKSIEFDWPVAQAVLQHHERLDGSGYPDGIEGDAIIVEARIIAVADVVEAMASHRPYRPSLGMEQALEELELNRGILYDDAVIDACLRVVREPGFSFVQDHPLSA